VRNFEIYGSVELEKGHWIGICRKLDGREGCQLCKLADVKVCVWSLKSMCFLAGTRQEELAFRGETRQQDHICFATLECMREPSRNLGWAESSNDGEPWRPCLR
jgi:hypothetical protein